MEYIVFYIHINLVYHDDNWCLQNSIKNVLCCLSMYLVQLISYKRYYGVYTHSMVNIYLSLRAQVAVGTFFMQFPVPPLVDYTINKNSVTIKAKLCELLANLKLRNLEIENYIKVFLYVFQLSCVNIDEIVLHTYIFFH